MSPGAGHGKGTRAAEQPGIYDPTAYPPFAVTVDLALMTVRAGSLQTVLVQRDEAPFAGQWALPGGFVQAEEDLDEATRRVFETKTGLALPHAEQLATYATPGRDPRMRVVSVAYLVLLPAGAEPAVPSHERAAFFDVAGLPDLAFDHSAILADAVARVQAKLEYTTLAAAWLPVEFTMGDLRRVYEAVWQVGLHQGNFTRKVKSVPGFVVPTGNHRRTTGAPELYRRGPAELMMPPLMRPNDQGPVGHTLG